MPDAPEPEYTGIIDSGAIISAGSLPPTGGVMRMTFGLRGFFGCQVVPWGEVYWFENFYHPERPDRTELEAIPDSEWKRRLLEVHRGDPEPIAEIIRSTQGPIGRWPVCDMPSLPTWHKGPVCLVGDAAHAMSPHVGQGTSLALEDAIELARCLRDISDVAKAFAAFERLRRNRVEKLVREARRTGNRKAASNSVTRGLRDLVLPFFLKSGVKRIGEVYSHTIDWRKKVA
jgi:2-polyprenyl-6-methoxyphenol hydroxylase-like FAD-dependent oxidoreductase